MGAPSVAALLTITLGKRRFFIETLMYHDANSVGVCLLLYEMRRSVEAPEIDWFDMMGGANHYKRLYEPDRQAPASYRLVEGPVPEL